MKQVNPEAAGDIWCDLGCLLFCGAWCIVSGGPMMASMVIGANFSYQAEAP
jgi:hypothetical protein